MSWTFEITTGKFFDPQGNYISTGYAGGNCGQNPEGVNNPSMCGVKSIGPLPEGLYTHGVAIDHCQLGAFAIPLIPDPSNTMYGRSGFYLHGDTQACDNSASEGCIIQPPSTRHAYYESDDHVIQVVSVK